MKTLCIDIGNTRGKAALMQNDEVQDVYFFTQDNCIEFINNLIVEYKIDRAIICSVVNIDFEKKINSIPVLIFNHQTKLPIVLNYNTPLTLGLDRIAMVVAANEIYKNKNCLVICAGTCITYNFIANGIFEGGAISPGIEMRLKAMNYFTNKLPLVENIFEAPLIGKSTESSLQSGATNGAIAEIEQIIAQYMAEYAEINVVLTGGDMQQLAHHIKSRIFADQHFLFKGLYAILQHNTN
jgi:type III pantothenate kinase